MNYPGNPELPADIQKRLLDAFDEALDLAELGKREEAGLGCDFILRTDPLFEPARILWQRVQQAEGSIDVFDLRPGREYGMTDALAEMPMPGLEFGSGEGGGGLDIEQLDVKARILSALGQRKFEEAVTLGMANTAEIADDPDLLHRLQQAQTRLESAPYISQFLESARNAASAGDLIERDRWLGKIRALDSDHPALLEFYDAAPTISTTGLFQPIGGFDFTPELPPDDFTELPTPTPTRDESLARFAEALEKEERVTPPPASSGTGLRSISGTGTPMFDQPLEMTGITGRSLEELVAGLPGGSMRGPEPAPASPAWKSPPGEDERIGVLINEGQQAFDRGEHQAAIDAWSRIFLIDIDHAEANRRIEDARRIKAEADRKVEELFHDGVAKFDAGDAAGARQIFSRVLAMQPGYLQAREFLTQIDSGSSTGTPALAAPGGAAAGRSAGAGAETGVLDDRPRPRRGSGEATAGTVGAAERGPRAAAAKARGKGGLLRTVGLAAVLLVGAYFAWSTRASWMPGSSAPEADPAVAANSDPIARARKMQSEGKTSSALQVLRRIPPGTAQAEVARALIAEWEALDAPRPASPPPEVVQRQAEILSAAHSAFAARRFRLADRLFIEATAVAPLTGAAISESSEAKARIAALNPQIEMFRQGSWEEALPSLWRLHEADPADRDVSELLASSYVNLGIRELQRESPADAISNLREALSVDENDPGARRLMAFAQSYAEREPDLQYRIFVKYMPYRG